MITATATLNGQKCQVVVEKDLESNYSVVVYSGQVDSVSLVPRKAAPLVVKVYAETPWIAADTVLRALKEKGRISDYELGPRPQAEIDAEEEERRKNEAKKASVKAAVAKTEADGEEK